ncbi:right-handed parallel beta-helix repeat-containing protein, partial [candidate division WOR-3 bacterium]|nr:right-handed parallel beta-helix repeat-containing protein [candidate division WOR-3 bacterium]
MHKAIIIFLILSVLFGGNLFGGFQPIEVLKIEDFGAKSNDDILDTEAINKAIDSCSTLENGVILFSSGTYLSGSIHLKSNVVLQIEKGTRIQAAPIGANIFDSPEPNKWSKYQGAAQSHFHNAFIWGDSVEKVFIKGGGTISIAGSFYSNPGKGNIDKAVSLKLCKFVEIDDINIEEGGSLAILATGCEGLNIKNVKIQTRGDGINIIGTRDVKIENCDIETVEHKDGMPVVEGDAIAIKSDYSLGKKMNCKDISISGCVISSGGSALQIGPETFGDFRNIKILNITIKRADKGGIIFTSNDGAVIDGVIVENVTMESVMIPIFINLSDRKIGIPGVSGSSGRIKNVRINNFLAQDIYSYKKGMGFASTIMGKSGVKLENIVLENMRMTYKGGDLSYLGLKEDPAGINLSKIGGYDRAERYGLRPVYGLYCSDIKDLKIRNVSVDIEKEDPRPAMMLSHIEGALLNRFYAERSILRNYDIILDDVSDFMITESPGVIQIAKEDFVPLYDFNVSVSPNPSAEEIIARLESNIPMVFLFELP